MYNYKIKIQYDGTKYSGWQIQKNGITVQQKIKDTIEILINEKINLIGSGRTDTGVHAFGQIANFKSNVIIDSWKFLHSLNSILPYDISVLKIIDVPEKFNARFDAVSRSYFYLISTKKTPFYFNYSWYCNWLANYDLDKINELSKIVVGEFDFTSFCRKNTLTENKICNIKEFRWRKKGNLIFVYVEANRFLHGMVRTLIGTVVTAAKDSYNQQLIKDILENKNRETAGEAVPAKGLFLFKVRY